MGYGINVPGTLINELPAKGSDVKIYTYYQVKEDAQSLYGFLYNEDLKMFKELIGVSGVGPKGALSILSVLKPDDLRMVIITGDAKSITRAPGVGRKMAERIILDLKDKLGSLSFAEGMEIPSGGDFTYRSRNEPSPLEDAYEALSSLGYSRLEAGKILAKIDITKEMAAEDILKEALKSIRL